MGGCMGRDSSYGQVIPLTPRLAAAGVPRRGGGTAASPWDGAPTLREALSARSSDPSATAFVLAGLPATDRPILWVQDRASRREQGAPYLPGTGKPRPVGPVLRVEVNHPRDVLWAMEEGASCIGLAAVVGEIHGAPAVLDFTATKRLALRAEASGVLVWLIRTGDPGVLSAARERWRVGGLPSAPNPHDERAPGRACWDVELFRARGRPPGRWVGIHDPAAPSEADRLRLAPPPADRAVARDGAARPGAARR